MITVFAAVRMTGSIGSMRTWILVCSSVLFTLAVAAAEPLGPGMQMPPLTLSDQHDVEASIGTETRFVVFARDMDGGDIVEEALEEDGPALLAGADAVFVSDIHRMPGVITTLFALPSMRKRPYRMLLDREGAATADLPSEEDKVSLIRLDDLEIKSVDYIDAPAQLRSALLAAKVPKD